MDHGHKKSKKHSRYTRAQKGFVREAGELPVSDPGCDGKLRVDGEAEHNHDRMDRHQGDPCLKPPHS